MFCTLLFLLGSLFEIKSEVVTLTADNYQEYLNKGHIFIKYYSPTCPHCKEVAPTFETLANNYAKYSDRITFAEIDCTQTGSVCDKAEIKGYPTIIYHRTADKKDKEEYNGDRSLDDFSKFIGEKIGVVYRSKPKLLKEVTPDNWNETVMDLNKNVLVAFTAPWCGHCKRLKPQMEMAAQSFKPEENISFVFIDAEKNMEFCTPYEVRGYPTIKFFPAAQPGDDKIAEEQKKQQEAKDAERKKRDERKAVLEGLKAAATSENATEEAKAAWTDELKAELKQIDMDELVEDNTLPTPKKGVNDVEPFVGTRSGAGIVDFINKRVGTLRALGGDVDPFAGLQRELAEPIVRYVHAVTGTPLPKEDDEKKEEPATEAPAEEKKEEATEEKKEETTEEKKEETAEEKKEETTEEKKEEEKPDADRVPPPPVDEARTVVLQLLTHVPSSFVASQYKRYMDVLEAKGLPALDAERERITRILESGHFTDRKKMELTVRKNVLSLFMTI